MLAQIRIDFASTIAGSVGIFRGTRRTTSGGNLNSSQLTQRAHLLIHNSLGQMLPRPLLLPLLGLQLSVGIFQIEMQGEKPQGSSLTTSIYWRT